ncbi:unnamed protein product [Tilletia controversa]|uniref:Myb-like domain-containing protein n=1 Tax=Tilletia controversa TaxID=13291 RepID=A0A8X7T022_9BASI|nr:hypothetical protein CF328_g1072 [Tilletia controversa]KAE8253340.1 hypothetical protein A4X06_0g1518 [Tilletia controversa]CAD6907473.1 unnamed protein product [Tilletia controversa]
MRTWDSGSPSGSLSGNGGGEAEAALRDAAMLKYFIAQRDGISKAEHQLDERIKHNSGAALLLSAAYHELELERAILEQADEYEEEEDGGDAAQVSEALDAKTPVDKLANFAALAANEPVFSNKAPPKGQIERLLSGPTWTAGDTEKLRQITLAECKSILAHRLLRAHAAEDVIPMIEAMGEDELAKSSLASSTNLDGDPSRDIRGQGSREGEPVDWNMVSQIVGRHSPDDCRTHWLMHAMPGINTATWTADEIATLVKLVQKAETSRATPFIPWDAIARELGTKRTPFACLVVFRRRTAATSDAASWTDADTDEMLDQLSVYGPQWGHVASLLSRPHASALVSKQLPRLQRKLKKP